MSPEQQSALPTGAPRSALIAGLISVALFLAFLFTSAGETMLYLAMAAGIVGIVLGIIAIRKRDFVGVAVTGLVLGAVVCIAAAGLIVFALAFVGAIFQRV